MQGVTAGSFWRPGAFEERGEGHRKQSLCWALAPLLQSLVDKLDRSSRQFPIRNRFRSPRLVHDHGHLERQRSLPPPPPFSLPSQLPESGHVFQSRCGSGVSRTRPNNATDGDKTTAPLPLQDLLGRPGLPRWWQRSPSESDCPSDTGGGGGQNSLESPLKTRQIELEA